jgi:hypothetical protein
MARFRLKPIHTIGILIVLIIGLYYCCKISEGFATPPLYALHSNPTGLSGMPKIVSIYLLSNGSTITGIPLPTDTTKLFTTDSSVSASFTSGNLTVTFPINYTIVDYTISIYTSTKCNPTHTYSFPTNDSKKPMTSKLSSSLSGTNWCISPSFDKSGAATLKHSPLKNSAIKTYNRLTVSNSLAKLPLSMSKQSNMISINTISSATVPGTSGSVTQPIANANNAKANVRIDFAIVSK